MTVAYFDKLRNPSNIMCFDFVSSECSGHVSLLQRLACAGRIGKEQLLRVLYMRCWFQDKKIRDKLSHVNGGANKVGCNRELPNCVYILNEPVKNSERVRRNANKTEFGKA